jgi:hypothetical protein
VGSELPDTVHTVKIQTLSEPPDKAAILAKKEQKIENPEKYKDTSFHPGAILLVGELLK